MAEGLSNHMFDQPNRAINYSSDELFLDALTGVPAMGLVFIMALFLGGFSFFTPWLIVTPPILFIAGLFRARSEGNPLLKGLVMSLPSLIIVALLGSPRITMLGIGAPLLFLPCALGVWVRRRTHRLSPG